MMCEIYNEDLGCPTGFLGSHILSPSLSPNLSVASRRNGFRWINSQMSIWYQSVFDNLLPESNSIRELFAPKWKGKKQLQHAVWSVMFHFWDVGFWFLLKCMFFLLYIMLVKSFLKSSLGIRSTQPFSTCQWFSKFLFYKNAFGQSHHFANWNLTGSTIPL